MLVILLPATFHYSLLVAADAEVHTNSLAEKLDSTPII